MVRFQVSKFQFSQVSFKFSMFYIRVAHHSGTRQRSEAHAGLGLGFTPEGECTGTPTCVRPSPDVVSRIVVIRKLNISCSSPPSRRSYPLSLCLTVRPLWETARNTTWVRVYSSRGLGHRKLVQLQTRRHPIYRNY
jgi:hypothetical protein